jgi:VanZ family protein
MRRLIALLVWRLARWLEGREWLPAALWAGAILTVSSIPNPHMGGNLFPGCDKVAHLIEYSILGGLLGFWVVGGGRAGGSRPRVRRAAWLVAAAILFGGLDEVHQRWIPGRTMDFWDFSADAVGCVFGFVVSKRWLLRRHERRCPAGPKGTS